MPDDERGDCWWLALPDGTTVRGDHGGGVALMREVAITRPLGGALARLRLSPAVDAADKVLAGWRGRLSRFVPDGPAPYRYP